MYTVRQRHYTPHTVDTLKSTEQKLMLLRFCNPRPSEYYIYLFGSVLISR